MNPRALSIGSASALVVAGLLVSLPAGAAETTCQGRPVTIAATTYGQHIEGTDGPDVISAVGYDDVVIDAKGGDDLVCAGERSIVLGGPGADTFVDHGYGILEYPAATAGVTIDLAAGTVFDGGEVDTIIGFHAAKGSPYADTFYGTSGDDTYTSSSIDAVAATDNDYISMRAGNDAVFAADGGVKLGPGRDRASVGNGTVDGGSGNDQITLYSNATARGGPGDDTLRGALDTERYGVGDAAGRFYLFGGPGRDDIWQPTVASTGSRKGCPTACGRGDIDGGPGRDTLTLGLLSGTVDLAAGRASTSNSRADLNSIEDVGGGRRSDVIRGDAGRNHLDGGRGDDVLVGRGGNDLLHGDNGHDQARGGAGRDRCGAEVRRSC